MTQIALMLWLLVEESATYWPCSLPMLCYSHAMVNCVEVSVFLIIAELMLWSRYCQLPQGPSISIIAKLIGWCRKFMLWLLVGESATVPCQLLMLYYGNTIVDCLEVPAVLFVRNLSLGPQVSSLYSCLMG